MGAPFEAPRFWGSAHLDGNDPHDSAASICVRRKGIAMTVDELLAKQEITELLHRHRRGIDRLDWELVTRVVRRVSVTRRQR